MPHQVTYETRDLYSDGATLSKFIHEGRPTSTKPTFVALPSLTSHSTLYKCLRGILCQPQDSPHSPLTRPGVIISYSLRVERKIILPLIQKCFYPNQYGTYIVSPAKKTTSAIIEVTSNKSLQFQVNRLNISRDTSIKSQPKNSSQNLIFIIPSVTLSLIYLYKTLLQLQHEHPYQHSGNTNG